MEAYMIGVLMISHGKMVEGIKNSVELIMGKQDQVDCLGLNEGNDFNTFKESVYQKIIHLNTGSGVIVLVDLFGASPYNATAMNVERLKESHCNIKVVTGINLPMVLETITYRQQKITLDELYKHALITGKDGIKEMFEEINKER